MGLYPWRLINYEVVLAVVLEAEGAVRLVFVWGCVVSVTVSRGGTVGQCDR